MSRVELHFLLISITSQAELTHYANKPKRDDNEPSRAGSIASGDDKCGGGLGHLGWLPLFHVTCIFYATGIVSIYNGEGTVTLIFFLPLQACYVLVSTKHWQWHHDVLNTTTYWNLGRFNIGLRRCRQKKATIAQLVSSALCSNSTHSPFLHDVNLYYQWNENKTISMYPGSLSCCWLMQYIVVWKL